VGPCVANNRQDRKKHCIAIALHCYAFVADGRAVGSCR